MEKNKLSTSNNTKKSGVLPPISEKSFESPITTKRLSFPEEDNNSYGANPITHECNMHRRKPLDKEEAELQLKKRGAI